MARGRRNEHGAGLYQSREGGLSFVLTIAAGARLRADERSLARSLKAGFAVGCDSEIFTKSLISMVGAQGLEPWTR
jgi:hypothetical protein